jgi:hypothetical protein
MLDTAKIALSAALIVTASSAALAKRVDPSLAGMNASNWSEQLGARQHEWNRATHSSATVYICPAIEGYPDCHS